MLLMMMIGDRDDDDDDDEGSQAADAAVEGGSLGGSLLDLGANSASPEGVPLWGIILIVIGCLIAVGAIIYLIYWIRSQRDGVDEESKEDEENVPNNAK
ncbi:hypothetical protein MAR_014569 [Mya arenaria]|uniref:Uncharacterized protein n=1 Tax=Mya arenaria TaxID=6604 RepID=A0ABY7G363_MYAAR|nr:hypothetical protein MAR_014569 [Mya arenaria]